MMLVNRDKNFPYYKLDKTEEDKEFLLNNYGLFNLWNEYLILNIGEYSNFQMFCLVNRTDFVFSGLKSDHTSLKQQYVSNIGSYFYTDGSDTILKDFPEFSEFEDLKKFSLLSLIYD